MIIYKATNIINSNIYIGMTKRTLKLRSNQHIRDAKNGSDLWFHKALKKYGYDNFKWEVLCNTDNYNKLKVLEKFYIAAYKTTNRLYNMTLGGEGTIKTAEEKKNISLRQTGSGNSFYGKNHKKETIEKFKISRSGINNAMYGTHRIMHDNPNYDKEFDKYIDEIVEKYVSGYNLFQLSKHYKKDRKTIKRRLEFAGFNFDKNTSKNYTIIPN